MHIRCVRSISIVARFFKMQQADGPAPKKLKLDDSSSSKALTQSPLQTEEQSSCAQQTKVQSSPPPPIPLRLKEEDVGITEYVGSHGGFFAILKQRYSDFHVHELDVDGRRVQLTSFSLPAESKSQVTQSVLEDVFSSDDIAKLRTLTETSPDTSDGVHIKASSDKDQRTLMHRAVKEHFPQLQSRTDEREGEKVIVVFHSKKEGRSKWPSDRGTYCKFTLYKENTDTPTAIGIISKLLRMKASNFHYAGMKDLRAITTQQVTAFKVPAEKLAGLNKSCRNMKIGNFEYVKDPLKLGSLSGNHFAIILRKVSCDDHVITDAMKSLSNVGFVNYFGMQRFGTTTVPTHDVGRCLLLSDWQGAIDLILKPRPGDSEGVAEAREYYWETKDASGTLAKLPKKCHVERQLLLGLEKHGEKNNLLGALNFIPRNSRMMYVHSWQSCVWNKIVSQRINECGLQPVVGDMVIKHRQDKEVTSAGTQGKSREEVEYITGENLDRYSIHDVVLPLPGYDVLLPQNDKVLQYLLQILKEDGLSIEQLKHKVLDFALPGAYRNIVIKPGALSWDVLDYDDVTIPLIPTDLDAMTGKTAMHSITDGKHKALKLDFTLPPSTYATMVVRELLRMDTSAAYQSTLT